MQHTSVRAQTMKCTSTKVTVKSFSREFVEPSSGWYDSASLEEAVFRKQS